MNFIDYFTWFVLLVMIACVVAVFVFLGMWPGMVAKQRNHPQADAIKVGSWITLIMGFVFWPLVLIWAYTSSTRFGAADTQAESAEPDLRKKIELLESRITQLESAQAGEK